MTIVRTNPDAMLKLYYKPACPFCQRVLSEAEDLGVTFDLKDVGADDALRAELVERGGKQMVPYLVDEERGVEMYESSDIIDYLKKHYDGESADTGGPRIHNAGGTCDVCE